MMATQSTADRKRLMEAISRQKWKCWLCNEPMMGPPKPGELPAANQATVEHDPPKAYFKNRPGLKPVYKIRATHSRCNGERGGKFEVVEIINEMSGGAP